MKKILAFVLLVALATSAFALSMSVGGGMSAYYTDHIIKGKLLGSDFTVEGEGYNVGIEGFFDLYYAQLGIAYRFTQIDGYKIGGFAQVAGYQAQYFSINALGKFPISLAKIITIFPLLGFEYDLMTVKKDLDGKALDIGDEEKHNWSILGGVGFDISFGKIFLRPEVLIGYRFLNKTEKKLVDDPIVLGTDVSSIAPMRFGANILVGYKL